MVSNINLHLYATAREGLKYPKLRSHVAGYLPELPTSPALFVVDCLEILAARDGRGGRNESQSQSQSQQPQVGRVASGITSEDAPTPIDAGEVGRCKL